MNKKGRETVIKRYSTKTLSFKTSLNSQKKYLRGSLFSRPQACSFTKKDTSAQVFSFKFSKQPSAASESQ